jgi:2-haloacid dehalogenase
MASEQQQIEAVAFDLGGVLIDWDPRYVYRQLFADPADMEEFLASVCTGDWHRAHDLGADITQSCAELAAAHPEHRDMIMIWADRGEEMAAGQFDDTVELLSELKASGMPCYALSNMEPDAFRLRRSRFAFMDWFDGHVISGLEGVAKPDRRIFEILLDRHGLRPQRCVFIDDQARNVDAARELGLIALHFSSASQLRRDLQTLGVA